jgi:peptidoglycan/xylan/chitin deacetylase (PgdA/CDA1 family)
MKTFNFLIPVLILTLSCEISTAQAYLTDQNRERSDFQWPEGKKMALSLTFDDARLSQIDNGIPLFDKFNVKATFYVSRNNMLQRLEGWKKAVRTDTT